MSASTSPSRTLGRQPSVVFRTLVVCDVGLLVATSLKLLLHQEHSNILPDPHAASLLAFAMAAGLCLAAVPAWRVGPSRRMWSAAGGLLMVGAGYPASYLRDLALWDRANPAWSTNTTVAMRYLAVREEDYRLAHGAYCGDLACADWSAENGRMTIRADGANGWSGDVALPNGALCSIRIGSAAARGGIPEGVPVCAKGTFSSYHAHNEFSGGRGRPRTTLAVPTWRPTIDSSAKWLEYRGDSARSGVSGDTAERLPASWRVNVPGEVRSTVSAASGLILIGTHDNGVLEARDAQTGALAWRARVPNWIHSEAVVSRGEAVVGFGSAMDQYAANPAEQPTSPSGVAAFSLATGRRLWQHATRGSVMTSAVIVDSIVVYATAFNEGGGVDLATGDVVWSRKLPGGAVMGSPASADGYVYFTLEPNLVCKVDARTGREAWCHDLGAQYVLAGHAAPAVDRDTLFLSAVNSPEVLLESLPHIIPAAVEYLRHRLLRDQQAELARQRGQTLFAISTSTGRILWKRDFDGRKPFVGHPAGAPTLTPSGVAIVLPTSHTVAMVRSSTGAVIWRVKTNSQARGPLTEANGRLLLATPEGQVRILDELTGRTICEYPLPAGSDRAGPTVYNNTAYFAMLDGTVIATPLAHALRCAP